MRRRRARVARPGTAARSENTRLVPTSVQSPLRDSRFRWFFAGRTVSVLGSSMTPVALAFAVLQTPNGQGSLGYVLAAQMIPMIIFVIVGGGLADRYRRDVLLVVSNVGAGVTQAGVAAVVLTGSNVLILIPLAALNGIMEAFTTPALRGIVPELVAGAAVQRANSILSSTRNGARILGPSIAGVLVASIGGGWAIALDAVTFFMAAFAMARLRVPSRPGSAPKHFLQDLRDGWSYFRSRSWIWSVTASFGVINAIQIGVWQILGPIISTRTFGASGWGLVLSARAAGLLVLSLIMLRWSVRRPLIVGMLGIALSGIPLMVLGSGLNVAWLAFSSLLAGMGAALFGILWDTTLQTGVPPHMLSRVTSFDDFGAYVAIPAGQLSVIPLASAFGDGRVSVIGGIVLCVLALLPLLAPSVRGMRSTEA